ncbi:MAG: ferredoxin family protein [Candidatus Melainabacteria bacterium]|nr:ferredoxin family protein [Candidatus Melainabacteria bacterium]
MPYTIVSEVCEGAEDCIPVCPVDCIKWPDEEKKNAKGFKYPYIDMDTCIDCGACLAACPIEGAVLDEGKPELQAV